MKNCSMYAGVQCTQVFNLAGSTVLLICKESEKLSGFVLNCYPHNPIAIIENMGLVQLLLKVTYVIILKLRLQ